MPPHRPASERFWEKVHKTDTCWLWTASADSSGSGTFWDGDRTMGAHRWSYVFHYGPVPDGLVIDHVRDRGCTSTLCVNPSHLEPVTHCENVLRGRAPTAINAAKTHCKQGHEFTAENTYVTPDNCRGCRACIRTASASYKARKAAATIGDTP